MGEAFTRHSPCPLDGFEGHVDRIARAEHAAGMTTCVCCLTRGVMRMGTPASLRGGVPGRHDQRRMVVERDGAARLPYMPGCGYGFRVRPAGAPE